MAKFIKEFFIHIGFLLSEDEEKQVEAIKSCPYKSLRVVGRGTIIIDVDDIIKNSKVEELNKKTSVIVRYYNNK